MTTTSFSPREYGIAPPNWVPECLCGLSACVLGCIVRGCVGAWVRGCLSAWADLVYADGGRQRKGARVHAHDLAVRGSAPQSLCGRGGTRLGCRHAFRVCVCAGGREGCPAPCSHACGATPLAALTSGEGELIHGYAGQPRTPWHHCRASLLYNTHDTSTSTPHAPARHLPPLT